MTTGMSGTMFESVPDMTLTIELSNPTARACRVTHYELSWPLGGHARRDVSLPVAPGGTVTIQHSMRGPAAAGLTAENVKVDVTSDCS